MVFLGMFIIPLLLVAGLIRLFVKKRRDGLYLAQLFFALSVAVGFWAISRSRSSTAAVGIFLLPFYGSVAGALGWACGNLVRSNKCRMRILGWICLLGAVGVVVLLIVGGIKSVKLNERRDAEWSAMYKEIEANRAAIQLMLQNNSGRESEVLNKLIEDRINDRSFLVAALESPFVSADILDRLSGSKDLGIELQIARNPNCRAETLTRLYRTSPYPPYLYQALATHPHTSPDVLRDVYRHREMITGLDNWFVKNPATPKDILYDIANRTK